MRTKIEQDVFEPIVRGIAQSGVRVANERAVLSLIAGLPGVSNADIARRSGLGPQTTARILSELEERDLVVRGDVLRGRRGQPATPYRLNPHGAYSFGVEIGWNHFEVLLQNIAGQPLASVRHPLDFPDPETIFERIAAEIATLVSGLTPLQRGRLAGIGVTTPGRFGPLLGRLGASPAQIAAWGRIDIAGRIGADAGLPAFWINDGSAAAWCEIVRFPRPRPSGLAAFFIGTFVGGGIVTGGALLEGPHGNAADLGAIVVHDRAGRPGHVHLLASLHALGRRLEAAGLARPPGLPRQWDWAALEPHAAPWVEDAGHALAQAIASTAAVIEIDTALINGVLPEPVLGRVLDSTDRHLEALPALAPGRPRVAAGRAGYSAAVSGAAQLVLFRRHFSRAWELFAPEPAK